MTSLTLEQAERAGLLVKARDELIAWRETLEDGDHAEFDWVVFNFGFRAKDGKGRGFEDDGLKLPPDLARAAVGAMAKLVDVELAALGVALPPPEETE